MSIPFLAWVFIRDEEEVIIDFSFTGVKVGDIQEDATVYEVDFNQEKVSDDENKEDNIKKAS